MALANSTQSVISLINTIQCFIDYFPMSILSMLKGKKYTSVVEFMLDVLLTCGVDTDEITDYIINKIFGDGRIKQATEWIGAVKRATSEEAVLEVLNSWDPSLDNKFFTVVEDTAKVTIGEILTALLSCSIYPIIPNWSMDEYRGKTDYGYLPIPIKSFDMFNKLKIMPSTTTGSCFYQVDSEEVLKQLKNGNMVSHKYQEIFNKAMDDPNGEVDDVKYIYDKLPSNTSIPELPKYIAVKKTVDNGGTTFVNGYTYYKKDRATLLAPNDMYKADDLDAFLWYVINRGQTMPQTEYNKMMWDSRLYAKKYHSATVKRSTEEEWSYWLNSKKSQFDDLYYSGSTVDNTSGSTPGYNKHSKLFPIMQLEHDGFNNDNDTLRVYLSSQKYFVNPKSENTKRKDGGLTDTFTSVLIPNQPMYVFNANYLANIKLFSTKNVFANLIQELYSLGLFGASSEFGVSAVFTIGDNEDKIKRIISNIIAVDDMSVEDCYYTFSNKDYDDQLDKELLSKYGAVRLDDGRVITSNLTTSDVIDKINNIGSDAVQSGGVTTTKRDVYSVAELTEPGTKTSLEITVTANTNFLIKFINALIYAFCKPLLSPKLILLYCINLQIAGIVDFNYFDVYDKEYVTKFIGRKVLALIGPIVLALKDIIVELLFDLYYKYVMPIIYQFMSIVLKEKIELWTAYIEEILKCIPTFDFNFGTQRAQITDVNYADIKQSEEDTPNNDKNC